MHVGRPEIPSGIWNSKMKKAAIYASVVVGAIVSIAVLSYIALMTFIAYVLPKL